MTLRDNWHPSAPTGNAMARQRRLLEEIWRLHVAFKDEQWLWRGHWCCNWELQAGIVTRVPDRERRIPTLEGLIAACQRAGLDSHDGCALPDLALLARLQHQGAATALLDVTTDPAVALFMACSAPPAGTECCDEHADASNPPDGVLVAVRRPTVVLEPFDSRSLSDVIDSVGDVAYYEPPPIDHLLRIQRGSFILYRVDQQDDPAFDITSGVTLRDRLKRRRAAPMAVSDVCVFRVQGSLKATLADLLAKRSGLSRSVIYPAAFDRPHLEQFAANHGRGSGVPPATAP